MRQFCRAAVSSARCTIPVKEGMRMAERMPMTASTMVSSKSVNPAFASLLWGSLRVRMASLTILIFIQYNTANGKLQSPRRHFSTKSDIYFPSSDNTSAPLEPLFRFCLCIRRYAPVCSWNICARQKNRAAFSLPIKEKALRGRKSGCRAPSGSTGRFRAAALSCRKLRFQSVCFCYPSVLLLSASSSRKILASQFFFVPCFTLFSVLFLLSFPRYALDGGAKHFYVHQND